MILWYGARDDKRAVPFNVTGIVTLLHADAEWREVSGTRDALIATGDHSATAMTEFGKGRHPRAGDSHKMDGPLIRGVEQWHSSKICGDVPCNLGGGLRAASGSGGVGHLGELCGVGEQPGDERF